MPNTAHTHNLMDPQRHGMPAISSVRLQLWEAAVGDLKQLREEEQLLMQNSTAGG